MFKLFKVWPLAVFLILLLILGRGLQLNPKEMPSARIGTQVPSMTKLDVMKQKVYLLHFWATWCDTCLEEALFLEKIKIPLVGVLYKDTMTNFKTWKKIHPNHYQILIQDNKGILGLDMGVVATPETFVIDKHGVIRYRYQGPLSKEIFHKNISPLVHQLETEQ